MKDIFISRTYLPPLRKYNKYLKKIWKANWLTNNGELVQELERKLKKRLGVKHVVCVDHGTSALIISARALGIKKKIYTSPYSFIASVSSMVWEGIKPIFVDLDEPFRGPALVTHVYGTPQLTNASPVIYDASHAFAVKFGGKSILSYGDVSAISFNAVKLFQTAEARAIVTKNDEIAEKARSMRNFGFRDRYSYQGTGI
ncbi:MAG: DegT/DnrJ/EryC1/StrS family aminotransferase, partial [Patescibacteria group bacterium]